MNRKAQIPYQATVGIDWADQNHDVCVRFCNGNFDCRTISSRPEAIQEWLFELRSFCDQGKIAIALEQRRGALFYQLCAHLDWIDLYPINPQSLHNFRQTFFCSRAKDDPTDSRLLEELLRTHGDRLRSYQPQSSSERQLDQYCRARRNLVNAATQIELKLIANLKQYFTLAVELFAPLSLKSDLALSFLFRWPSLDHLRRSNSRTLRAFFYAHNCRSDSLITKRLDLITRAQNVPADPALAEPFIITTKCLLAQLRHFNRAIKEFDQRITQLFCSHPDRFIFESFPGAGRQMAPRLLSVFGSDRSRWPDCTHIQRYSGIAPVMERSGKSIWIHHRFGRPKFLCQTFHEFALHSIPHCSWAQRYYRLQRQKGKSNHSAIRALAFKWIRILFACWKHHHPYDESILLRNRSFTLPSLNSD
jgi:transposase